MEKPYLKAKIREIKNFPTKGIRFKDITPLLEDKKAFKLAIDGLIKMFRDKKVDKVVGIDARGFLLASAVAYELNAGMVIVRKTGKLPFKKLIMHHGLEYGKTTMEIHVDAIKKGERIAIIDDVLATGGTAEAAVKLVERLGGNVIGVGLLLEMEGLGGRERLKDYDVRALIQYPVLT